MSSGWVDLPFRGIPTVAVFSLLPDPAASVGAVYAVILDEGANPSGMYYSSGASWDLITDSTGTTSITGAINVGTGSQVYKDTVGQDLRFRTLIGSNMSVVQNANDITLTPLFANSASPGYTWGIPGAQTSGTWLHNDGQSSNLAGRAVQFASPVIKTVGLRSGAADTYNLGIYQHDGTTYTLLYTIVTVGSRAEDIIGLSVAVTQGKELAVRLTSGTITDGLVVSLTLSGTT